MRNMSMKNETKCYDELEIIVLKVNKKVRVVETVVQT